MTPAGDPMEAKVHEPVPPEGTAGNGRKVPAATVPWNSGEITGSSRRRRASGERSCHRTLRGATRRSVDSVTVRAWRCALRRASCGSRCVAPVRNRSTTAEMTLPLFGNPPCFSATNQCFAPGSAASRKGTVPSPSRSSV